MKYINVVGAFALTCATTALAASCLIPYNIDEAGSCGGTPQEPTPDACQQITYAPANRSECDPSPTGTYTCNNVIAHVMKTTNQLTIRTIAGVKVCWWTGYTSSTVDTGQLCLWANQGTDTCP